MKKNLLAFLLLGIFAISFNACKKDEGEEACPTVTNTWSVGSKSYSSSALLPPSFSSGSLTAFTTAGDVLTIEFKAKPTASGTYKVVLLGATLADNECKVSARDSDSGTLYFGTGSTGSITVCVEEGKVKTRGSSLTLTYIDGGEEKTASLTFNVGE